MADPKRSAPDRPRADLLIRGAREILTCAGEPGNPLGRRTGVGVAIRGERIIGIASEDELARNFDIAGVDILDASGMVVAPGFVDCHTHLVFGGSRVQEYAARMTMDASDVRALGIPTGIQASVEMTRAATVDQLTASGADRLQRMLRHGSTTVESKSGYGLSLVDEVKMLQVNRELQARQRSDVVSTFLGAHDFPPGVPRERYINLLVNEMIPYVAEEELAEFCDVYCDEGYYTVEETLRILEAGLSAGLRPKIHVDAYADIGGAEMAAELGAVSADHLNYTERSAMRRLAEAGVIGVVMPGLDFAVRHPRPFDARAMMDEGMTLALATDLCPACWVESMHLVMQLACRLYRFSPEEALLAATMGGAQALGMQDDIGSLEQGKVADLQIWDLPTIEDVIYRIGHNAVAIVVKRGKVVEFAQ